MLRQDHFCSFKHHADVKPCKFLVSLAASSISEIYFCNPYLKKVLYKQRFRYIFYIYVFHYVSYESNLRKFAGHSHFMGDNDS